MTTSPTSSATPTQSITQLRYVLLLGPWKDYLERPELYKLFWKAFNMIIHRFDMNKVMSMLSKDSVDVITRNGMKRYEMNIFPLFLPGHVLLTTRVPRLNILSGLSTHAWMSIILDIFGCSGHVLEAEYARLTSIPTILIREAEVEKEVPSHECYVLPSYPLCPKCLCCSCCNKRWYIGMYRECTKLAVIQRKKSDEYICYCPDKDDIKIKVKGCTGMLNDLVGNTLVTLALNSKLVNDIKEVLRGQGDLDYVAKTLSQCLDCAISTLLEQYQHFIAQSAINEKPSSLV